MAVHFPARKTFIAWCARLVLLAYAFQLGAVDHLAPASAATISIDEHANHCHGDPSGCGNTASLTYTLAESDLVPLPPAAVHEPVIESPLVPEGAAVAEPERPPRAVLAA